MKKIYPLLSALALVLPLAALAACGNLDTTLNRGYILQEGAIDQVPVGASKEQALFILGTPSTTSTFDGEVLYYISQQVQNSPFLGPQVKDQRVLAIYLDKNQRVVRIASYGLADGKVVDIATRKTPTGGREITFLQQIFNALKRE